MTLFEIPATDTQPSFKISGRLITHQDILNTGIELSINPEQNDEPCTNISFDEAVKAAKALGGRLPTSDEWERAWEVLDLSDYTWTSTQEDNRRVVRGGSFDLTEGYVRAAYRYYLNPVNRYIFVGFRVVVS